MGLAIDGNEVHGIARGGQAFLPYSNKLFDFSKAVLNTKIYFSNKAPIGERRDTDNDNFMFAFQQANSIASNYNNFNDCRVVGATYISKDNIDTASTDHALNVGAGLHYIFSECIYYSLSDTYSPSKICLIRADQVVFTSSNSSGSSMMS